MIQFNANQTNGCETQVQKILTNIQSRKYKSTQNAICVYKFLNNMFCYCTINYNLHVNAEQLQQILPKPKKFFCMMGYMFYI